MITPRRLRATAAAIVVGCVAQAGAEPPRSFNAAKRVARDIYADHRETFYCGCVYEGNRIRRDGCGYNPRRDNARAYRVEWEHVVPARRLGAHRPCWRKGGRRRCRSEDPEFRAAEADLANLVPVVGELNGDRSSHPFGEVPGEARRYGRCDFEVAGQVVEPRPEIRGDIARIYFWVTRRYGVPLSDDEFWRLTEWASRDPIDEWERERWRRVRAVYRAR